MIRILRFITISFIFLVLVHCSTSLSVTSDFLAARELIVSMEEIEIDTTYSNAWLLEIKQPVDHYNPGKGSFRQRVWLSHKSREAPVVLVTEGYMAPRNYTSELARIVEGNQVIVEHRFFDSSVPDSIDWKYLTIEQAAMDHHRVVELLKRYYPGKWINTGISKGGQTAMIHRALFPEDVDITVAYVAPFNLEKEDSRLVTFFENVGTREQREQIFEFQKEVLKRRDELMPLFLEYSEKRGYTYRMGDSRAFELIVLEYPFSLWQWCGPVDQIPVPGSSAGELFAHLQQSSDFGYFSDQQWEQIGPFFYQAYKELGYYPYLATPLKPWLEEITTDTVSKKFMAPNSEHLTFNRNVSLDVFERLKKIDPEMIVITGENDPWSATSLDAASFSNVLKIEKPGGCHQTRINNLPDSLKQKVIQQLDEWLE